MTSAFSPGGSGGALDIRDAGGFLYVDREILVNVADVQKLAGRLRGLNAVAQVVDPLIAGQIARYRLPAGAALVPAVVAQLRAPINDEVPRVGPNHVWLAPNWFQGAPAYHGGPGASPVPAPAVPPTVAAGNADPVVVAIIDTGVDPAALTGPILANRFDPALRETDPVHLAGQPGAIAFMGGHGTMVAGVLARHAPRAVLLSVKVLDAVTGAASETEVVAGMQRAVNHGATVLNLSFGGYVQPGQPPVLLDTFLGKLPEEVSVVAAAGNYANPADFYPAAHHRVVGVAALDTTRPGAPGAAFSNFGGWVNACAPGTWIHGAYVTGSWAHCGLPSRTLAGYTSWSGTSFAAPMLAAAIADGVRAGGGSLGTTPRKAEAALLASLPKVPKYGAKLLPPLAATYPQP